MKYGFVYIWFDKKKKRYYIGSHWGTEDDGYICSSRWMRNTYKQRPQDFKRRILTLVYTNRKDLLEEERRWLQMIDDDKLATKLTTEKQRTTLRYYNITKLVGDVWHSDPVKLLTIGEKISKSKTGKSVPAPPGRGEAISKAKKGKPLTEEHKQALRGIKKPSHTDEWKEENSKRMKEQWSNGSRKRKEPKITMTLEEQGQLSSSRLKSKWADPIWATNQRTKLKASWDKRKKI